MAFWKAAAAASRKFVMVPSPRLRMTSPMRSWVFGSRDSSRCLVMCHVSKMRRGARPTELGRGPSALQWG